MEDGQLPITVGHGAGREGRHARPAAVHAGRRDHARRPADDAAARPLRHPAPPRSLRRRRARAIVRRSAALLDVAVAQDGARAIAARTRGTPRVANRLLKRVRDYAEVRGDGTIDAATAAHRARPAGGRPPGPRPARPRAAARDLRAVRRRPRRPLHARRRGRRGAGHDRGRLRALPAPARASPAHAARPRGDAPRASAHLGLRAPAPSQRAACSSRPTARSVRFSARGYPPDLRWRICSSARTAATARPRPTATPASATCRRAARSAASASSSSCSTTTTRRPTPPSSSATRRAASSAAAAARSS